MGARFPTACAHECPPRQPLGCCRFNPSAGIVGCALIPPLPLFTHFFFAAVFCLSFCGPSLSLFVVSFASVVL
jgi:hypothetical protein